MNDSILQKSFDSNPRTKKTSKMICMSGWNPDFDIARNITIDSQLNSLIDTQRFIKTDYGLLDDNFNNALATASIQIGGIQIKNNFSPL